MRKKRFVIRSFVAMENQDMEYMFHKQGPFWHLCTPGTNQEILFRDDDDYRFGITSAAICLEDSVRIYALAIMSNHLHDILAGKACDCLAYFERRKKVLKKYLDSEGKTVDMREFNGKLIPIENLDALRTEIVYVNRNGYVASPKYTPFSYPWSTGMYYFNPASWEGAFDYSEMPYKEKRILTHSRIMDLPPTYKVKDGTIHIPSFVRVKEGEGWFRDAHQYFNLLSRNREAYGEVAKRLGDEVFLTDNELFDAVCAHCRSRFGQPRPSALSPNDKVSVAVLMKREYNASNGQIRRMLRLDDHVVRELFP